jgi:hypothetical protein
MNLQHLRKVFHLIGAASFLVTSGCATAFVRSKNTVDTQHVFPATTFDGEFFWYAGVQGEPFLATVDANERIGPMARTASCFGSIIDLPFYCPLICLGDHDNAAS